MSNNIEQSLLVNIIPTERFKTTRVSVLFSLPLRKETVSANAIIPFLLRRTSKKYPTAVELNKKLARLYGAELNAWCSKLGENQILRFTISMVSDRFSLDNEKIVKECVKLLNEILFNPNIENNEFLDTDIKREKRLLLEKIESEMNDKRLYAFKKCQEIMFENEYFGIDTLGNVEDIKALTSEQIYTAYQNMLKTAKVSIIGVGEDIESSIDILKDSFSKIDRSEIALTDTKIIREAKNEKFFEEKMPVNQAKLVMGFRTAVASQDEDVMKTRVMCDIFGGGPYSLLFTNVREKMSLCYYCSARFIPQKGVIFVQSGIENENKDKAIAGIKEQLEKVKNGDFTQTDFDASISSLADNYSSVSDTPEILSEWYAMQMLEDKILQPNEYIENLKKITMQDVIDAAKKVTLDTVYMLAGEVNE